MTPGTAVVSTIGAALRRHGIGVSELQRRLARRGVRVSRGALDRLASDRPLKSVNFALLLPILEELGLPLGEPFVALSSEEFGHQRTARARAQVAAQGLADGHAAALAALDDADRADEETIEQIDARMRREHPEAFDERGRLRKRVLSRALARRFGGTRLTREQVGDVIAAGREAAARRRAAR